MQSFKFLPRKEMDMMELSEDDFIGGVTIWTAEDFLKYAKDCRISLFYTAGGLAVFGCQPSPLSLRLSLLR